jgi:membrane-bound lytic murein transglycosylase D
MGERMRVRSSARRGSAVRLSLLLACSAVAGPAAADLPGEVLAPLAGATSPTSLEPGVAPLPHEPAPARQPSLAPAPAPPRRSLASRQPDFPKSPALVPRVEFWKRIYSEVDTGGGLLHDANDLAVVYEVVRLPGAGSRVGQERFLRQRREHYQTILRRLAAGKRSGLDSEERRVLSLFPPGVSDGTLRAAAGRVRFQLGQADKFRAGLIRQGRWENYMRGVFAERGLPVELASLPHVESSFNPAARSHVGASGLWQFTRSTGRLYMRVDHLIDERNDPWIATVGAARLLRSNYERTRSWPLALTGYNHGVGGMERAARQLGTRDMATIIERYQGRAFGFASKNFYTSFLAALEVEENAGRYFGPLVREAPENPEIVTLDGYYRPNTLAAAFGVSLDSLRAANLALMDGIWKGQRFIPKGYALRVPRNPLRPAPELVLASIPAGERHVEQVREAEYRVRRGDTLSRIAARFGVRTKDLMAANGLRSANRIRVGQRLEIPGSGRVVAAVAAPEPAVRETRPVSTTGGVHRVRSGDTLGRIARRYGVSERELAEHNGIKDRRIVKVGQKLSIPGGTAAPSDGDGASAPGNVYTVRRGDTLDSIARRHGTTPKSIAALNGLRSTNRIKAGQRLVLPAN